MTTAQKYLATPVKRGIGWSTVEKGPQLKSADIADIDDRAKRKYAGVRSFIIISKKKRSQV
jgi:hypothetical protein